MLRLRLKELYALNHTTQKEVSEQTGIRASTLSGMARGSKSSWDILILERLIIHFNLDDISELIEYSPSDKDAFMLKFNAQKNKFTNSNKQI